MSLCGFKGPKRLEWYAEADILPTVAVLKKKSHDRLDVLSSFEGE
jgi:hypothetical protein